MNQESDPNGFGMIFCFMLAYLLLFASLVGVGPRKAGDIDRSANASWGLRAGGNRR